MAMLMMTVIHDEVATASIHETFLQIYFRNSEAFASEFLKYFQEVFPRYYKHVMSISGTNL